MPKYKILGPQSVACALFAASALFSVDATAGAIIFLPSTSSPNTSNVANTGAYGSSAHVSVGYSGKSLDWGSGYGGLGNGTGAALYSGASNPTEVMTFVAAAGYLVTLDSFDLAQYGSYADSVDISVTGGSAVYSLTGQTPAKGIGNFTTYSPGMTGSSLTLTITNLANVGLNNIRFSEAAVAAVPEPTSLALVFLGGMACTLAGRRRQQASSAATPRLTA